MSFKYYFKFLGPVASFAVRFKYVGIFLSVFLGVIGLPLPMEGLLTYVGYRAYRGKLSMIPAFFAIILGGIAATLIGYWIVRSIGVTVMKKYVRNLHPDNHPKGSIAASFARAGKWGLVVGYFLPVIRHLLGPLAAILEFEFLDFFVLSSLGCTIWTTTFFVIGGIFGKDWEKFSPGLQHVLISLTLLTALSGFIFFLVKLHAGRRPNGKG